MEPHIAASAATGAVLGALIAMVGSLVIVAVWSAGGAAVPTPLPALATSIGGVTGALLGLLAR